MGVLFVLSVKYHEQPTIKVSNNQLKSKPRLTQTGYHDCSQEINFSRIL